MAVTVERVHTHTHTRDLINKKQTLNNKGITLLALIITIVILLILAVVTIGAIKNSSIITHSKKAKDDYTIAQEEEQIQLALVEWQLQKNSETEKNFREVMKSELANDAEVEGEDNGPLTVTFKKTGHAYEVSADGKIEQKEEDKRTPEEKELALKKIIFGEDLEGRILNEILTFPTDGNDLDVPTFDENTGITFVAESEADATKEGYLLDIYVRYNKEIYKFKVLSNWEEDNLYYQKDDEYEVSRVTTLYNYGLTKIAAEGENVGKTVWYDEKKWTILYNDTTNGLQMICNDVYEYDNTGLTGDNYFSPDDEFYLGSIDSSIKNWDSLIADVDLNQDERLNEFEKAVYSYNKAIETLNKACKKVVKANDNISVRCVGSNPTDKESENSTIYTSDFLTNWIQNNQVWVKNRDGIGKSTDYNYVSDFDRMVALGINNITTEKSNYYGYWLASRIIIEDSAACNSKDQSNYTLRYVGEYGECSYSYYPVHFWTENDGTGGYDCDYEDFYLRPVITLSSFDCLTSDTSQGTDYVLE